MAFLECHVYFSMVTMSYGTQVPKFTLAATLPAEVHLVALFTRATHMDICALDKSLDQSGKTTGAELSSPILPSHVCPNSSVSWTRKAHVGAGGGSAQHSGVRAVKLAWLTGPCLTFLSCKIAMS